MWLIDAYRHDDKVVLWYNDGKNVRIEKPYSMDIYLDREAEPILRKNRIWYDIVDAISYMHDKLQVCRIRLDRVSNYERFVRYLERLTKHRVRMYNADIKPEQMYLYQNNLTPFVDPETDAQVRLKVMHLHAGKTIEADGRSFRTDKPSLQAFISYFIAADPDCIIMPHAFSELPKIVQILQKHGLSCPFHRWDAIPIRYRGGKSFFSYGTVRYQDYAIRLHGRLLIDSSTPMGESDVEAIMEIDRKSVV